MTEYERSPKPPSVGHSKRGYLSKLTLPTLFKSRKTVTSDKTLETLERETIPEEGTLPQPRKTANSKKSLFTFPSISLNTWRTKNKSDKTISTVEDKPRDSELLKSVSPNLGFESEELKGFDANQLQENYIAERNGRVTGLPVVMTAEVTAEVNDLDKKERLNFNKALKIKQDKKKRNRLILIILVFVTFISIVGAIIAVSVDDNDNVDEEEVDEDEVEETITTNTVELTDICNGIGADPNITSAVAELAFGTCLDADTAFMCGINDGGGFSIETDFSCLNSGGVCDCGVGQIVDLREVLAVVEGGRADGDEFCGGDKQNFECISFEANEEDLDLFDFVDMNV